MVENTTNLLLITLGFGLGLFILFMVVGTMYLFIEENERLDAENKELRKRVRM
ncbi:hypothetical protein [Ectobacillus antri]|uniref:hypothetical protein n=1 Tax=Ectobacillus antri TaxID=2486280 RepID=UPI0013DDFE17|nr:hypothetical protein [Ectobacillus antri]